MSNANYRIPGVSGTVVSSQNTSVSSGARFMACVGDAGKGPDVPTYFPNMAAALAAYGNPGASTTSGKLPKLLQAAMSQNPAGGAAAPCIGVRIGVSRAGATLPASGSGIAAYAYGIGAYAGSAGNGMTVKTSSAAPFTVTIADPSAITLAIYTGITTGQDLMNATINDPSIDIIAGAGVGNLTANGTYTLALGTDGVGTDPTTGILAAALTLLFSGVVPAPRYLAASYDAQTIYSIVAAALSAAATAPAPALCIAFLGAAAGSWIPNIATTAGAINNAAIDLWGLPGATAYDPVSGIIKVFDGYYQAASQMGVKAALPVEQSTIGVTLSGWNSAAMITATSSITVASVLSTTPLRLPTLADVKQLGAAGASYGLSGPGYTGLQVVEALTTAPQTGSSQYASQLAEQDCVNEIETATWNALKQFQGQPAPINTSANNTVAQAIETALSPYVGNVLVAPPSISVAADPNTPNRYLPAIGFVVRQTMKFFDATFSVSFQ